MALFAGLATARAAEALPLKGTDTQGGDSPQMITIIPEPTDELLLNPGKGWMIFSGTNPGKYGTFPEASVAYLRANWADLEPAEGQFNWEFWEPALRFWIGQGKRLALGVMCANAHSAGKWTTPQWVADAGAKGYDYVRQGDEYSAGARLTRWEPDYGDPVFLAKLEHFVNAFAARYDGDPAIEFVDVRSYGIWGEWHTPHPASTDVLKRHLDLHRNAFRRTQLVVQWGMDANIPACQYAFDHGIGFRRDGIGGPPVGREGEMYPLVWGKAPVVFEFWGRYEYLKQKGWWTQYPVEAYMEKQRADYISLYWEKDARTFVDEEPAYIRRLGNRMGYWFVLAKAEYPTRVSPGQTLDLALHWENRGVGACRRNYPVAVFLLDAASKPAFAAASSESDCRRWEPGKATIENLVFHLPAGLAAGTYALCLGLVDSPVTLHCALRLGIKGRDELGRYRLGTISIP
jgi:hypothetical protein